MCTTVYLLFLNLIVVVFDCLLFISYICVMSTVFFPNLMLFHILYVQAFVREIIEPALKEIEQMPAKGSNLDVLVVCGVCVGVCMCTYVCLWCLSVCVLECVCVCMLLWVFVCICVFVWV